MKQPEAPDSALVAPDAHGIVDERRASRFDGWTVEVQIAFIEALRATGTVAAACRAVGRGSTSAYLLRKRSESFAKAWDGATRFNALDLERLAMERAVEGSETVYFDADGKRTRSRRRQSMGELNMMLRAAMPEKYGTPGDGMRARAAAGPGGSGGDGSAAARLAHPRMAASTRPSAGGARHELFRETEMRLCRIRETSDLDPLAPGYLCDAIFLHGTIADAERLLDETIVQRAVLENLCTETGLMLSKLGFTDSLNQWAMLLCEGEAAVRAALNTADIIEPREDCDNRMGPFQSVRPRRVEAPLP